jgi:hypothetical protein
MGLRSKRRDWLNIDHCIDFVPAWKNMNSVNEHTRSQEKCHHNIQSGGATDFLFFRKTFLRALIAAQY